MYSVYGGTVDITGEICHGKTSPIMHDGKGMFAGVSQNLPVTRYHSLAGTHDTLPDCLEITAWTELPTGEKNIVMGIRHKEYVMEGVQFHPESILSEEGRMMMRNFLQMRGGTWAENERLAREEAAVDDKGAAPAASDCSGGKKSILQTIYDHRMAAVEAQKKIPALSFENLQKCYDLGLAPPSIPFPDRLKQSPFPVSLMAEIKRASPSKGIIAIDVCAPAQAREYAAAGASVISVLTEPEWFKGSIDDLKQVRQALDRLVDRPAILRKEFIFDEYQILEARLAGADTVLLIVKMLDQPTLRRLYTYSRSLGMEPLVEVNTRDEMDIAVSMGSKVIGVNNRNLTSFEVDLGTTTRLLDLAPAGTVVCALSGIAGPADVQAYQDQGVHAVLVGEALMRAANPRQFASRLLGGASAEETSVRTDGTGRRRRRLVKICGTRTVEAAQAAVEAGADLVGMILVPGRRRFVSEPVAKEISRVVHTTAKPDATVSSSSTTSSTYPIAISSPNRALVVGVFQNQSLEHVLSQIRVLDLDLVQLHGDEPVEWAGMIPVPVIRSHRLDSHPARDVEVGQLSSSSSSSGYHAAVLLDSGVGGTGERVDVDDAIGWVGRKSGSGSSQTGGTGVVVMLAGGLGPDNVKAVVDRLDRDGVDAVVGLDVSSGVEGPDGSQDLDRIRRFITEVKRE